MQFSQSDFEETLLKDAYIFYSLCSEKDRLYFSTPQESHTVEQYVRLTCICIALSLQGMSLTIFGEVEKTKKFEDFTYYLNKIKYDYDTVTGWINDFIDKIKDGDLKTAAINEWTFKQTHFTKDTFEIGKLY